MCGTQLTYGCEPFASPEKSEEGKTTKKIRQQKRPWAKDDNAKPNVAEREEEKRKGTTAVCVSLCVDDAAAGGTVVVVVVAMDEEKQRENKKKHSPNQPILTRSHRQTLSVAAEKRSQTTTELLCSRCCRLARLFACFVVIQTPTENEVERCTRVKRRRKCFKQKKTERESNRDSAHAKTRPRTHIYIRNNFLHEVYPLQRYVYGHGYCSFSPHSRLTQLSLSKLLRFLFFFVLRTVSISFHCVCVCVCADADPLFPSVLRVCIT